MNKEQQLSQTKEIIEKAYQLLTQKLANGGLIAQNEQAFQLEFGFILKTLGQLYEFSPNDSFGIEFETYIPLTSISLKSKSNRARIDILIRYQNKETVTVSIPKIRTI